MALTNDLAALIGFACEAVCWGTYSVLFLAAVILLVRRLPTHGVNATILAAVCLLYMCCSAHFVLEFHHYYSALVSTGVDGFANETKPLIGADILISLCDLLGDFILLYRCWIVWDRRYCVIILPVLTALAGFGCIMEVAHIVDTLDRTTPVAPPALVPLGIAGYALPLATNVMTTVFIVAKLWSIMGRAGREPVSGFYRSGRTTGRTAVAIIVESGLLYLVTQLIFVVLFSMAHPAQAILAVIAVQVYGIAPTLIIIRVALGITSEHTIQQTPTVRGGSGWHPSSLGGGSRPHGLPAIRTHGTEETLNSPSDGHSAEMKVFDSPVRTGRGRSGQAF
ncbi:hypothetical protein L226DRAFT_462167 [Lentinus tigrinus ALCF2SS1-7]|uniref:uncharacterized protein n=1 Tax=Lentinus tigrinus ALCF2SS1-7 TaxID=1328758 RepID=UPI001165EF9D|nr:hypothetical protein L226DRAFT_462167 [Lentinus tigrinus ALCF2SS1-7]